MKKILTSSQDMLYSANIVRHRAAILRGVKGNPALEGAVPPSLAGKGSQWARRERIHGGGHHALVDAGEEEADEGDAAEGEERVVPQRREERHLERGLREKM